MQLSFEGTGGLAYQVVGRAFIPWQEKPAGGPLSSKDEPLSIKVDFDRHQLATDNLASATTSIHNNQQKTANMVMVDLGIPPGFELLSEDLQTFQEHTAQAPTGRLEKFTQTATQAILYFNALAPNQTVTLTVHLRAKFPIRAKTFQSRVYEYYDPAITATAPPANLEVTRRP